MGIKVPEEIADTPLKRVWHDRVITHGDRTYNLVQPVIESVNLAVKSFPGVVFRIRISALRAGTCRQQQAENDGCQGWELIVY